MLKTQEQIVSILIQEIQLFESRNAKPEMEQWIFTRHAHFCIMGSEFEQCLHANIRLIRVCLLGAL